MALIGRLDTVMMIMTGTNDLRNLLGRLNARSYEDLGEIAAAWRVPVSSRDRGTQVSALYRAMTRPTIMREMWDGFSPQTRSLVQTVIAAGDDGLTVDEVSEQSGLPQETVRAELGTLYRSGLIASEGSILTLPVGESPIVFVPRELATAIANVVEELERGDISNLPFVDLIALRPDRDLFEAADLLRLDYVPGLATRSDISDLLAQRLTNPTARMQMIDGLSHDVRTMWDRLQSAPPGTPISVESLISQGNDRTHFGRLTALNDLEDRMLIWPTVMNGARSMFVPVPGEAEVSGAIPKPLVSNFQQIAWRPESPIAWDLTVLLQRLIGPLASPDLDPLELSVDESAMIARMLWNATDGVIPPSYLATLLDLAAALALVEEPDDGSTRYERTERTREWRLGPWGTQAGRLRSAWMNAATWIEGDTSTGIEPWQVDWQGYRVKLLHHLSALEPDRVYRLSDLVTWIAEFDPELVGSRASVAVLHPSRMETDETGPDGLRALLRHSIVTVLNWFGLVDLVPIGVDELGVRINLELRRVTRAQGGPDTGEPDRAKTQVLPDLTIELTEPSAIQVWSILAFADPEELGQTSRFQMTSETIRGAQFAGFRTEQITQFLERQADGKVPNDLATLIEARAAESLGIDMTASVVITAANDEDALALATLLGGANFVVRRVLRVLHVAVGVRQSVVADVERISSIVEAANLGVVTNRIRL